MSDIRDIYELTPAEKEALTEFDKQLSSLGMPCFADVRGFDISEIKSKASYIRKDPIEESCNRVEKPGNTIQLNWSHEASEKLGKVKSVDFHNGEYLTVDLVMTAPGQEWIDKLKDYIFEEENRYRTQCLNLPGTVIGPAQCLTGRNVCATYVDKDAAFETYKKQCAGTIIGAKYESDAIDACRYAFENLKLSLRSAQDREIAKYSVKDKSELMTPYDIWEQNKKGELPMNTYDVAYNEKKAAAQKAYDEVMLAAKKEKEAAAQKEANENAAKTLKGMYDAYVNAGFTPEQAEKFVTIALEKAASKI